MASFTTIVLLGMAILAFFAAVGVTTTSYRAYTTSNRRTYRFAVIGFACLATSVAMEAVLLGLGGLPSVFHQSSKAIELLLLVLGFGALYLSIDRPAVLR